MNGMLLPDDRPVLEVFGLFERHDDSVLVRLRRRCNDAKTGEDTYG